MLNECLSSVILHIILCIRLTTPFFDALYWATVTLTMVGYGDLTPVTDIGRFVSMLSSLFGVAIIALPSGFITASYLEELRSLKDKKKDGNGVKCEQDG